MAQNDMTLELSGSIITNSKKHVDITRIVHYTNPPHLSGNAPPGTYYIGDDVAYIRENMDNDDMTMIIPNIKPEQAEKFIGLLNIWKIRVPKYSEFHLKISSQIKNNKKFSTSGLYINSSNMTNIHFGDKLMITIKDEGDKICYTSPHFDWKTIQRCRDFCNGLMGKGACL